MSQSLQAMPWSKVEHIVRGCVKYPELANLLAAVHAGTTTASEDRSLFVAEYAYGEQIVGSGGFCFPRGATAADQANTLQDCKSELDIGPSIPLALVLENCVEVFVDIGTSLVRRTKGEEVPHTAPVGLLGQGELFGVFEALDKLSGRQTFLSPWQISAGARTVRLLMATHDNKVTDYLLKEAGHPSSWRGEIPDDSWLLFKELVRSKQISWRTRVLLIPWDWVCTNSGESSALRQFLYRLGWEQSAYLRESAEFEMNLQALHHADDVTPDVVNHLSYMISVSRGQALAFVPCRSAAEARGPFEELQELLLKSPAKHYPVILQPSYLKQGNSGFYSASMPSVNAYCTRQSLSWPKVFHKPICDIVRYNLDGIFDFLKDDSLEWRLYGEIRSDKKRKNTGGDESNPTVDPPPESNPTVDPPPELGGRICSPSELAMDLCPEETCLVSRHPFFNAFVRITRKE